MNESMILKALQNIYPGKVLSLISANQYENTSHDVLFVNYALDGKAVDSRLIFKVAPLTDLIYKTIDMKKEVDILKVLGTESLVNVPKVVKADFSRTIIDRDYFVMEEEIGIPISTLIQNAKTLDEKRKYTRDIAEILVKIHNVDIDRFSSLMPVDFAQKTIDKSQRLVDLFTVRGGSYSSDQLQLMHESLAYLRRCEYSHTDNALINGDIDTDHILLRTDGSYVTLDWDPCEIGDKSWDIFWTVKEIPGLLLGYEDALDDLIEYYEQLSKRELRNKVFFRMSALVWAYVSGWYVQEFIPNHIAVPTIMLVRPLHERMLQDKLKN